MSLEPKLRNRTAKIAILGLGYVGLPLAIEIAKAGYQVFGIDISEEKINRIKNNEGYEYEGVVLKSDLEFLIDKDMLILSTNFSSLNKVDAISICVPTPLDGNKAPDTSYITSAVDEIIKYLRKETLIILESTTYPGSTEDLIEKRIKNTLKYEVGNDYYLCFSPERVDPGNLKYNLNNTPKVIGGLTTKCLEMAEILYSNIIEKIVPVSSVKVAETVKLLENTFRMVNIALVNELTIMTRSMGINLWEVIDAAATKPFGYMPFYPGPGVGGHCIPIDPMYLSWSAKKVNGNGKLIDISNDINENMPRFVENEIISILNLKEKPLFNSAILLLGITYKKDVGDLRESPALKIYELLKERGANVSYHDPKIPTFIDRNGTEAKSKILSKDFFQNIDLVIILADHSEFDYEWIVQCSDLVYDTRNATKGIYSDGVFLLGEQPNKKIMPMNREQLTVVN
jgi:UDP-N-acetyl-D-glucosamine dehydrogenase